MKMPLLYSLWLMTALTLPAWAIDFQTRTLMDKTYVHDNTYCRYHGKNFEIEVRSFDKYTEQGDSEYGEHIFLLQQGKQQLLPINQDGMGSYRLLKGTNQYCTKSLALSPNAQTLSIFFLKDNRPFGDQLYVLSYNVHTAETTLLPTTYAIGRAEIVAGKLKFQSLEKRLDSHIGRIVIDNSEFIYQEKLHHTWKTFDGNSFEVDNTLTYEKSEIKNHFAHQNDFERNFGWDAKNKNYVLKKYYYAINHHSKKECIAVPYKKKRNLTHHKWRCRSL